MDDETVVLVRHKLDVDDYDRMANAGIFEEDDRIELIDGELIDMAPIGQEHAATVGTLTKVFVLACGEVATVWCQNPTSTMSHSQILPSYDHARTAIGQAIGRDQPTCCFWSRWQTAQSGSTVRSSCRCMRGPASARFGLLILNDGLWTFTEMPPATGMASRRLTRPVSGLRSR